MRMKAGKGEERDPKEELMDGIDETLRKLSPDPSPPKEALSGGKIFSLTFGISLLLLILLMIFVLSGTARGGQLFSGQSLPSVTEGSVDHSMDNYRPGKENGMRILLLTAAEGEAPAHYWLLRISPVSGEMLVLSFPDSLLSEDGEETLSLRKASESLSSAEAAVKAIFGKENVSRTIRLTRENAASLVSALGGMDWEFTTRYQSQSLDIPPGRHRLDGETLLELLDAAGTASGKQLPSESEILAALLGQRLTEDAFNKDDGLFTALVTRSEGTLSAVDYYGGKKFIRWFLRLGAGFRTITLGSPGTESLTEGELEYARSKLTEPQT